MNDQAKPFRPLLAATIEQDKDLLKLEYPLVASPKVDGIRVLCHPIHGPCTRSLKAVPNVHIRTLLTDPWLHCLDGEITQGPIAAIDVFNRTTSAVMTQSGEPEFTYWVFDDFTTQTQPYIERLVAAKSRVMRADLSYVKPLPSEFVENPEDVLEAEREHIAAGFEGIMLRHKSGPYKWGRSTLKQQTLMKLKRFCDAEAEIIGFEPLLRNTNEATRNILGLTERTSHKAGKVQAETLGNLLVRDLSGRFAEFSVGSGFDQELRDIIWSNRDSYRGQIITYKYQNCGVVEAPRFPIFKGFRQAE